MKKSFWVFLFFLFTGILSAQEKTHTVQAKETLYGISHQYGVTQKDLEKANPFLQERGLQIGDVLRIPGKTEQKVDDGAITVNTSPKEEVFVPEEDADYIYLKVQAKQTLYAITKEYKISEDALKSLNPQLEAGLKAGDVIRIPKTKNVSETELSTAAPEGMYWVKKGDTVFSLVKEFGVTEDEFYIANPMVQTNGLKVETYINIPQKNKSDAVIQDGFIEHKVKQGETVYSITKLYKISFTDLLKHNPELKDGLKTGMTLKIPLAEGANIVKKPGDIKRINDDEINIALILPFHLNNPMGKELEKNVSMDLLMGAKIALDSLARKGKDINLSVLDSENKSGTVEELLTTTNFSKFDAIVGPLFGTTFKSLAGLLQGSGIAMVSPLSNSDDLQDLENVLIATPSDQAIADAVIRILKENYKGETIQILTDDRDEDLANYVADELKKTLNGASVTLTKDVNQLVQKSETVQEKLSDGTTVEKEYFTPIITILVSENNALGEAYVKRIKEMDAENLTAYGIKYVAAYDIYSDKNKANIAALKNIGFTFGTIHLIDIYGDGERAALEEFMNHYCLTPTEYQKIGYDILYDLVDRMNDKGDVLNSLNDEQTRLSTKFRYVKKNKAYVNEAVRVIRLYVKQDESPDEGDDLKD